MRLRLPDMPRFARPGSLSVPGGARPDVASCVASGTLLLEHAGIETARLDAECLLGAAIGRPRWQLMLEPERRLSSEEFGQALRLFQRREQREPLAYILGTREFWSLPFSVSSGVLVPRPETETLVEAALAAWDELSAENRVPSAQLQAPGARRQAPSDGGPVAGPMIVELCTGSGAVGVALATEVPTARIVATDVSWRALRVARANAERHGVAGRITFLRGNLCRALDGHVAEASVDLMVANPPYIPTEELETLMPEVQWEPPLALDGGSDGLRVVREIIETSPARIRPGGFLMLEIGTKQAETVQALASTSGHFEPARIRCDLAGRPRVIVAQRRGM